MSMLLTSAKKIVRENIQRVTEEATLGDAISAFHAAGAASAVGAANGKASDSFVVTCTGLVAGSFQQMQHEIDRNLKAKGLRLVSVQYHEDPVYHATTHHCVVKVAVTI